MMNNSPMIYNKFQFVEQMKTAASDLEAAVPISLGYMKPKCFSASMMAASFSSEKAIILGLSERLSR